MSKDPKRCTEDEALEILLDAEMNKMPFLNPVIQDEYKDRNVMQPTASLVYDNPTGGAWICIPESKPPFKIMTA